LTLPAFEQRFRKWLLEDYHYRVHSENEWSQRAGALDLCRHQKLSAFHWAVRCLSECSFDRSGIWAARHGKNRSCQVLRAMGSGWAILAGTLDHLRRTECRGWLLSLQTVYLFFRTTDRTHPGVPMGSKAEREKPQRRCHQRFA